MTRKLSRLTGLAAAVACVATMAMPAVGTAAPVKFGAKLDSTVQPSNSLPGLPCLPEVFKYHPCTMVQNEAYGRPDGGHVAPRSGTIKRIRLIALGVMLGVAAILVIGIVRSDRRSAGDAPLVGDAGTAVQAPLRPALPGDPSHPRLTGFVVDGTNTPVVGAIVTAELERGNRRAEQHEGFALVAREREIEEAAAANEILIGEPTHRLVRDAVVVEPSGPRATGATGRAAASTAARMRSCTPAAPRSRRPVRRT